jgi:hypothetical protein
MSGIGQVSPVASLLDLSQEFGKIDVCFTKGALQSVPIDVRVKWENDPSAVLMFHFDMAILAVNLHEAQTLTMRPEPAGRKAGGASQSDLDHFLGLVLRGLVGRRLQVELNRLSNILDGLFSALTLRPAALQRRTMGDKIAILTLLHHNLQSHCGFLREASVMRVRGDGSAAKTPKRTACRFESGLPGGIPHP